MHRFATAAVFVLLSLAPATAQNTGRDEVAVRTAIASMERSWNVRDAAALAALFAPDGDLVLPGAPRSAGRDRIRQALMDLWSRMAANNRISISVTALRFIQPGAAIAETLARFSAGPPFEDRATSVWVQSGGAWQIAAFRVMAAEGQ